MPDRNRRSSTTGDGSQRARTTRSRTSTPAVPTQAASDARIKFIFLLLAIFAIMVVGRLVYLSLIVGPSNSAKAEQTRTQTVTESAKRGTIYDRNGIVLASDIEAISVYCNPHEVTDAQSEAKSIAAALGGAADDYIDSLTMEDTTFAYLYRKADKDAAAKLKEQGLDGVYFLEDTKRVYPYGQTAGQIVGMCDVDGNGLTGLELYYDDILSGKDGTLVSERGANGYPIAGGLKEEEAAVNGQDIVLSIDVEVQEYLEARLSQCVSDLSGKSGNAILYDGATGEIVACASLPYLDPSNRTDVKEGSTELKPITWSFEPGSIFKTVSMSAVLESGVMGTEDTLYCPAALPADEYYITDEKTRSDETMTLRQIMARSSNVGMSLAAKKLGFGPLYEAIERYNLTTKTGVDYPGESSGYCDDQSNWTTVRSYNVSFGQGILVSPLQITRFYGSIANDGVECTPHFLLSKPQSSESVSYSTEQVFQNTAAIEPLTSIMQSVVSEGTGTGAQITGFSPAGKTGTAEYVGEDGEYISGMNNISFVGFLPNTTSELVCFVGVTEVPGDNITTPAFKDIMTFAINHYGITSE